MAVAAPQTVLELLKLKGIDEQYGESLIQNGYGDLEGILTASQEDLERLAKDLAMPPPHLYALKIAIKESLVLIESTKADPQTYCAQLQKKVKSGKTGKASESKKLKSDSESKSESKSGTKTGSKSEATPPPLVTERALTVIEKKYIPSGMELEKKFDALMKFQTDTSISREDEKIFGESGSGFTYGYMCWGGVAQMLGTVITERKVFYDLGSGVGRPVFAAAMQFSRLKKAVGIELSKQRHEQAVHICSKIENEGIKDKIELRCENILESDISDADIVYISSLCFSKNILERIGKYLNSQLKRGAIVFTSKETPMARAEQEKGPIVAMSWNAQHQLHKYVVTEELNAT